MVLELRERLAGKLRHLMDAPLHKGDKQATLLAVASSKGGVGKTTTAVNLAVGLSRRAYRTLLIDLDPQAHVAASLRLEGSEAAGLSDVLLGRLRDVSEVARPSRWANLHTAGSDKGLAETEMVLAAKIGKELILHGAMEICRSHYDVVVLDCPPNLGTLTLNALCAADQLLVPSDMSVLALEGVADILVTVQTLRQRLGSHLQVCGIVATRVDKRVRQMNEAIETSFAQLYGDKLLSTRIPQTSSINRAHMAGKPIYDFDPRSTGALAYAALTDEVCQLLGLPKEDEPQGQHD